jgi:hypothetical protein
MDCPIPNNDTPGNRMRGSFPLPMEAGTVNPPNHGPGGDGRANTFLPMAGGASPVNPPNAQFKDNWGLTANNRPAPMPAEKEGARLVNPGNPAAVAPAWEMRGR